MDPDAMLRILVEAFERGDTVEAGEAYFALQNWLRLGGWTPMLRTWTATRGAATPTLG